MCVYACECLGIQIFINLWIDCRHCKGVECFFRMIEKKKKKTIIIIIYFLDHFDFLLLAKQTNKQKKIVHTAWPQWCLIIMCGQFFFQVDISQDFTFIDEWKKNWWMKNFKCVCVCGRINGCFLHLLSAFFFQPLFNSIHRLSLSFFFSLWSFTVFLFIHPQFTNDYQWWW